jgi:hemin uptake protein HemP
MPDQDTESVAAEAALHVQPPVVYRSDEILQGRREVWIEHAGQMYRLRLTQAHKLYLTK